MRLRLVGALASASAWGSGSGSGSGMVRFSFGFGLWGVTLNGGCTRFPTHSTFSPFLFGSLLCCHVRGSNDFPSIAGGFYKHIYIYIHI